MIIITSEYVYYNNNLNETSDIVENSLLEHEQKHGANYHRSIEVTCVAEILDKVKSEMKIIITKRYNLIEELNKIIQSSNGMIELIRIDKIRNIIKRRA